MKKKITVASMFAGIGGIDLAFEQAGFSVVWANEIDKYACRTYRLNFGDEYLVEGDIQDVKTEEIPDFDVLISGFPCQAFSSVGLEKGFEDPHGNLFFETARVIAAKNPRVVFFENVANLVILEYSFPKRYIWTQCCFENGSLMLSVADIPILGFHFTGIIGVILLNGKEYRIATYLGARIKRIGKNAVTVKQGAYEFTAELLNKNAHPLFAPTNGDMSRTIHESASCKAHYRFLHKNNVLCDFISEKASFEFEYFDGDSALETASN